MARKKKNQVKKVEKDPYLYLVYDENTYQTREGDDEPYSDRGETSTSRQFKAIVSDRTHIAKFKWANYESFIPHREVSAGERLYLTVVEYNTGDSFGWDENRYCTVVSCHDTVEAAQSVLNFIKLNPKDTIKGLVADDGQVINDYAPWVGYFESIHESSIVSFVVDEPSNGKVVYG